MFFILLCNALSHKTIRCGHDSLQNKTKMVASPIETTRTIASKKRTLAAAREHIRIHFDYHLESDEDEFQCVDASQIINWSNTLYTCTKGDIPSESAKNNLKGSMENVRNYLQDLLLVDRVVDPYEITTYLEGHFNLSNQNKMAKDTDLFISVFIRTYGDESAVASSHAIRYDPLSFRPTQGAIYFNSRYLPKTIENENTASTYFYYTAMHEIIHALGLIRGFFGNYHPKDSFTPYKYFFDYLSDEETGKVHFFLVTPHAHKFAVMQWGEEYFTLNNKTIISGIELEDGGGEGTFLSHPEIRIANQDLMVGASIQDEDLSFDRVTPVTAAFLLDTGNYDIEWSKILPLVWGNKDSIDGNYIKDFALGPPIKVFPQQYLYHPSTDPTNDKCGFNFKTIGTLPMVNTSEDLSFDCNSTYLNDEYCSAKKYYNPYDEELIGRSELIDFQIFHYPDIEICSNGESCIAGLEKCVPYNIANDNKSFNLSIPFGDGTLEYECNSTNVGVINSFTTSVNNKEVNIEVKCPPIEQFIRSVKMMEEQKYYTSDPFSSIPDIYPYESEISEITSDEEQSTVDITHFETDNPSENPTEIPTPNTQKNLTINDSYELTGSEITFTANGYKDKDGKENIISNEKEDILLIKFEQKELTILGTSSSKDNLFVSPQIQNSIITISPQTNIKDEFGIHANSNNPTINLPQSYIPLNLFNNQNSEIIINSNEKTDSVPISLKKLTISDGAIQIKVPEGSNGIEFNEVETHFNGNVQTFETNAKKSETAIGNLIMKQGSNLQITKVNFKNSIKLESNTNIDVNENAKFNGETVIDLTETSFIDFKESQIEGICKSITIVNSHGNGKILEDENELNAQLICGVNFNCNTWKEKYIGNSKFPYSKCTEDQKKKCLVASSKKDTETTPDEVGSSQEEISNIPLSTPNNKKKLKPGVIAGIVIGCLAFVAIVIVGIIFCIRCKKGDLSVGQNP